MKAKRLIVGVKLLNKMELIVNENLEMYTVLIEDRRFELHYGHDFPSIIRALFHNIFDRELHGASTIEQQLIRVITNDRIKTYRRKINELLLSTTFHKRITKLETIRLYINYYFFSEKTIGVNSLCETENYPIVNQSAKEISEIIARFKYPNINSKNYTNYLKRVRTIEMKIID